MEDTPRKYVEHLKAWNLPRLEKLEDRLVSDLLEIASTHRDAVEIEQLAEGVFEKLREIAETAVNETIGYWMGGLANGLSGRFPERCLELPFLEREESIDPLTLTYCVDNQDGTRAELSRFTLTAVLMRVLESDDAGHPVYQRLPMFIAGLRELAGRLERGVEARSLYQRAALS